MSTEQEAQVVKARIAVLTNPSGVQWSMVVCDGETDAEVALELSHKAEYEGTKGPHRVSIIEAEVPLPAVNIVTGTVAYGGTGYRA